jgi:hypothetical protein
MGYPCAPVLLMLRTAGEAVAPLAGQLAAKGYDVVDAVGADLSPALTAPGFGLPVVDMALVSAGLSASPDLPGIAARLRESWPGLTLVRLPDAGPGFDLPALPGDLSLDEICEQLDEIVLETARIRTDADRLRREAHALTIQVRRTRGGLEDAVADARRLLAEARQPAGQDHGRP